MVRSRHRALDIVLIGANGEVSGEVLDLSVRGCGTVFPKDTLDFLEVGDEVEIEFRSLLLLAPLRVAACVRRIGELGAQALLGLEFLDPDEVAARVPFVLSTVFDRRKVPRTVLRDTVNVRIQTLDLEDKAVLLDLSPGGARLRLGPGLAFRIQQDDQLELRFRLNGLDQDFWFFASVRGVRLARDHVSCSVAFDAATTLDYETQRAAIESFIGSRRRSPRRTLRRGGAA